MMGDTWAAGRLALLHHGCMGRVSGGKRRAHGGSDPLLQQVLALATDQVPPPQGLPHGSDPPPGLHKALAGDPLRMEVLALATDQVVPPLCRTDPGIHAGARYGLADGLGAAGVDPASCCAKRGAC